MVLWEDGWVWGEMGGVKKEVSDKGEVEGIRGGGEFVGKRMLKGSLLIVLVNWGKG